MSKPKRTAVVFLVFLFLQAFVAPVTLAISRCGSCCGGCLTWFFLRLRGSKRQTPRSTEGIELRDQFSEDSSGTVPGGGRKLTFGSRGVSYRRGVYRGESRSKAKSAVDPYTGYPQELVVAQAEIVVPEDDFDGASGEAPRTVYSEMGESPQFEACSAEEKQGGATSQAALRYPILILDHDDTAVDSTRSVHHASLQHSFKTLKEHISPDAKCPNLAEWFELCGSPELVPWLKETFGKCWDQEQAIWEQFKQTVVPEFFEGWIEFLNEYRRRGGKVVVASHSDEAFCRRHYTAHDFEVDLVYGWSEDPERRKPHPNIVTETIQLLSERAGVKYTKDDVLVVDDLPTGYRMAKSAEVAFVGAQWCHKTPSVEKTLRDEGAEVFIDDVSEFYNYALGKNV